MSQPSPRLLWHRFSNSALVRFLLLFACGWAIVELLAYFEIVVVIFTCATILAFLLSYPVRWLNRFLPRGFAVFLVFAISFMVLGGLVVTLGLTLLSQGQRLAENLTVFLDSLAPVVSHLETLLQERNIQVDLQAIEEPLRAQALSLVSSGLSLVQILLTNLIHLILIAVVAFFMLLDGERIWDFVLQAVPEPMRHRLNVTIQRNLLGFFWGRFLLSPFFAASSFVVFLIIDVPYALFLAAIAGVFDLIPGIGATLGIGLVALIVLSYSPWMALQVIILCIVLQQVEENLLLPRIMQDSLNINPVVMFFALLMGARIAGLLGIFLAIPIAGVVVSLFDIEAMKGRISPLESTPTDPDKPLPTASHCAHQDSQLKD